MIPQSLYHGTSSANIGSIITEGLTPREGPTLERASVWSVHPSRSDCVYLTTAYAGFFASNAMEGDAKVAIVEVNASDLRNDLLLPDEDYVEFCLRRCDEESHSLMDEAGYPACGSLQERTAWVRENLEMFFPMTQQSIDGLGNCCYRGVIPPSKIRVWQFDQTDATDLPVSHNIHFHTAKDIRVSNRNIWMNCDPCITPMNYAICGAMYREMTLEMIKRSRCVFQGSEMATAI